MSHSRFARLVPLFFVLLWSTGFIGAKYALPYIEPFYLLFIRMLLTLAVFTGLALVYRSQWPSLRQGGHQAVVGFLVHACYLGGVFAAIKWQMPAGITAIIVGLQPLLTALIGWQWLGERLRSLQWIGLILGLLGVIAILLSGQNSDTLIIRPEAIVAALLALVGISLGTLYQKRFGGQVDLLTGSIWQYLATAVVMGILAFFFEERHVVWSPTLLLALGWLVFGLSISAILLLMFMIREGEAARVASYFYLVPPVTTLEAWILFGESLNWIQVAAIMVTVCGVYLVLKPGAKIRSA
ncbi:DMT family transporter [Amphritea japonica]|uniref:Peptide ABC transporter ATP-binding protein n=1 Tax=Amphritea japonica ATCC BAA-1530 TaxID=1278309 RepID=A0A7R6SSC7_9GAMM|nr:EamA family transporter [Amphritea japonica]BBB26189.1 peptide ABC transporter ATP-binding protein [Amphritea japonica ATCC BAA-1530]